MAADSTITPPRKVQKKGKRKVSTTVANEESPKLKRKTGKKMG